jgi:hypothetical protein
MNLNPGIIKTSLIFLVPLALVSVFACHKENPQLKFNVGIEIISLMCFPNDSISLKFKINSTDGTPPYTYEWANPATFTGEGPFTMNIIDNTSLDVIVADSNNTKVNFHYEIKKDTIDPLKHDYRTLFTGNYKGTYIRTWKPMQSPYPVTDIYTDYVISVTKHKDFKMLTITVWGDFYLKIKDLTLSSLYISKFGHFEQDKIEIYDSTIDLKSFRGQKVKE